MIRMSASARVYGTGRDGTSVSTSSSVSTMCSLSGDEASAGITTTGLMCSDRAEARRKFGGFCRESQTQKKWVSHWLELKVSTMRGKQDCCCVGGLRNTPSTGFQKQQTWPYLRKLWDLYQPFKILQVTGTVEQTLQPEETSEHGGVKKKKSSCEPKEHSVVLNERDSLFKLLMKTISVPLQRLCWKTWTGRKNTTDKYRESAYESGETEHGKALSKNISPSWWETNIQFNFTEMEREKIA